MIVVKKRERNHWKTRQLRIFSRKQQHVATSYLPYNIMGSNSLDLMNLYFHQLITIKKTGPIPTLILGSGQIGPSGFKVGLDQIGLTSKWPKFYARSNIKPG